tara:strand:- start:662 stop:937 length:276 start_codon:yes stop_codon:yes gene_type:complete
VVTGLFIYAIVQKVKVNYMSDEVLKYIEEKYGKDSDNYEQMKKLLIEMENKQELNIEEKKNTEDGLLFKIMWIIFIITFPPAIILWFRFRR